MKFSYKFSNLLGTVYKRGNVVFTKDGNVVVSPVGNKVSLFDLKNNTSETLPVESRVNITNIAVSPCGNILVAVTEDGDALACSLVSKTVLSQHRFTRDIHDVKFSPNGKYISFAKGATVFTCYAPSSFTRHLNTFHRVHVLRGFHDHVTCVNYSSDSRVLVAGSKDMTTRIVCIQYAKNMRHFCLGGHIDAVVGCFFEENSLNLYTVSRNGAVNVWECSIGLDDIEFSEDGYPRKPTQTDSTMDEVGSDDKGDKGVETSETSEEVAAKFKRVERYFPRKHSSGEGYVVLTSAAFHQKMHILVTGFSNGAFFLHEMPEFNLIHSLSIAEQQISTIEFNSIGDWIAIACGGLGQLIVWEWQSETYILKQQGHFNNMRTLAYSPDGQFLATGGDDGKVKLWNLSSGFCYVTFSDHTAGVSVVSFSQNGKVVISASLDGTVRAFDVTRYRNFRTFTSPQPTQFSSLALDSSGEIICAGGQDTFDIFVWSMQTGRLLEVLSGHEAPVSSLTFSSFESVLVSGSWDKSFRIWDVYSEKGNRESLNVMSDVLAVVFRPDGLEIAVSTLNGHITFFDLRTVTQTGSIEGRKDLGIGRRDTDLVTAKQVQKSRAFTTLCYAADGQCILAAGHSKYVCIYNVRHQILMKKFEITQNRSLDGMDEICSRRKMSEFGNLGLVEERDADEPIAVSIPLPGVKRGDMASRSFKPEVQVSCIKFSPTGRCWAATTTEGLLLYSLDHDLIFDPLELEKNITVSSIRETLHAGDFIRALMMALKLSERQFVVEVVESIKPDDVELVVTSLTYKYVKRMIRFLADQLESSTHLEFYLLWVRSLLMIHGQKLKTKSLNVLPLLHNIQRTMHQRFQSLEKICDHNKFTLQYITALGDLKKRKVPMEVESDVD